MVSLRPFIIPAYYKWLIACNLTPHLVVDVNYLGVVVPSGYDDDGKIVLDISPDACQDLLFDDYWIVFKAVFAVELETVRVPMGSVLIMFAPDHESGWFIDFTNDVLPQSSINTRSNTFKVIRKNDLDNPVE